MINLLKVSIRKIDVSTYFFDKYGIIQFDNKIEIANSITYWRVSNTWLFQILCNAYDSLVKSAQPSIITSWKCFIYNIKAR